MLKFMKKLLLLSSLFILTACVNQSAVETVEMVQSDVVIEQEKVIPSEAVVPVLIYHHIREIKETDSDNARTFIVSPENFSSQMQYLKDNGFNTISFGNLIDYFKGEFDMPEKPIIISFDDGVVNHYQNAWPILQKNNLKATFFIFPNPIGRSKNYMTWEQLQELIDNGMEIGSHGWYHLYLDRIEESELQKELVDSKQVLEEKLGIDIRVIAYPFGSYNEKVTDEIKSAGYEAARDIVNGRTQTPETLYKIKGYFITENFSRFKNIVD